MSEVTEAAGGLISIIIPAYNSDEKIENCLQSIITQSYERKELVIVDGGSSDSTVKIITHYAALHAFIRYVSERDKGIYDAMNKGIELAKGDWMLFLGSDDVLHDKNVLSNFNELVRETKARFVYGNVRLVGDSLMGTDGSVYDGVFSVKKLFEKNISHQAIFYSRYVFQEIGQFTIRYSTCADWDFNHRCFAKYETQHIDLIVSKFVTGGLSSLKGADLYTEDECIFRLKEYYRISFYNNLFKSYCWVFAHHANKEYSRKHFGKSFYYFFFYFKHSCNKTVILKILLKNLFIRIRNQTKRIYNKNMYFL
ncbi:MAG: glycosyltransferase family 2 protein [Chitinophagaceae bacterium]